MITTKTVQADRRLPAAKDRRGIDDVGSIKTAMQAWTAGQHEGGSTPDGGAMCWRLSDDGVKQGQR